MRKVSLLGGAVATLFALFLLAGCATEIKTPIIEPANQNPPSEYQTEFNVKIHVVAPPNDVQMTCIRNGATFVASVVINGVRMKMGGCSRWDLKNKMLTMWVRPPAYLEDNESFSVIGHELWHAVAGDFHKEFDSGEKR